MFKENNLSFLQLVHVIKEPNTFKHSDNVRDHLKNIRNYFEQTKCPDNLKLQLFLKYLSLSVLEDLQLQMDYNNKVDLSWYEDKMLELYDDRRSLVTILVELVEIKQNLNESTIDFASRIKEKVENKKIPLNMQENVKLQLFINGLMKKNYSKVLKILNPKTLSEAINMLRLDFNIIDHSVAISNPPNEKVDDYLHIIKSLCDKISPINVEDHNLLVKPKKTDNILDEFYENHKSMLLEIMQKLSDPNSKGVVIFPKSQNDFQVLDIPQTDIMVGIPFGNKSYELVPCKSDSGYLISNTMSKKHKVYKLPSTETIVINESGRMHVIKKPTLIGPSKFENKMDLVTIPESMISENNKYLSCDQIISMLDSSKLYESPKSSNEIDLFEEPLQLTIIDGINTKTNGMVNVSYTTNDSSSHSKTHSNNSIISDIELKDLKSNSIYSSDLCNLENFQLLDPISTISTITANIGVDYLCNSMDLTAKDVEQKEIQLSSQEMDNNCRLGNIIQIDQNPNLETIQLTSIAKLVNIEQETDQNNFNLEANSEKTIGRFKVTAIVN